jgi:hypothetical protein
MLGRSCRNISSLFAWASDHRSGDRCERHFVHKPRICQRPCHRAEHGARRRRRGRCRRADRASRRNIGRGARAVLWTRPLPFCEFLPSPLLRMLRPISTARVCARSSVSALRDCPPCSAALHICPRGWPWRLSCHPFAPSACHGRLKGCSGHLALACPLPRIGPLDRVPLSKERKGRSGDPR